MPADDDAFFDDAFFDDVFFDDVFFDDFAYRDSRDERLTPRGWTVRSRTGGPGTSGATWSTDAVTFPTAGNTQVLQLESSTDGTAAGTVHAEVFQQRKFHKGTYAARVRLVDTPAYGPDGDQVVQAFFTITPLAYDLDPDYGELDFEYLPNGGWGEPTNVLLATSWETYRRDPWLAVNTQTEARASYAGWHELTIQVADGRMRYFVDGRLHADHGDPFYPETPMSINVNQWFIQGGLTSSRAARGYRLQVDYVFFVKERTLNARQIAARIAGYRAAAITHVDTVPEPAR